MLTESVILVCMAGLEEELKHAIAFRNELAVELAGWLLDLASDSGKYEWPIHAMIYAFTGEPDGLLADIEALTAVILNRAGMSWDAIAAQVECSKQALHRRHAARGEDLFNAAISPAPEGRRTIYARALLDGLHNAENVSKDAHYIDVVTAAYSDIVPARSAEMIARLRKLPEPKEILTAGNRLASTLMEFRKFRRWWWRERDDLKARRVTSEQIRDHVFFGFRI